MNSFHSFETLLANFIRWFTVPRSAPEMNRRNFLNVQIDAVGVGLASTASPFLAVFLARLEAPTVAITALTFMPAITGLLISLPLGQFLQTRRNIVPWFSMARFSVLSCYALTGIITLFLSKEASVIAVLVIWAAATIPQTILNITFSVVMNSVAGPAGRYELMTHRWSILGFTNFITSLIAAQVLELESLPVPLNYQVMFITLSVGGLISYYFSSKIVLPDHLPTPGPVLPSLRERLKRYFHLIWDEKPFVSFVAKRFVFLSGTALVTPLFTVYYVRTLNAGDSHIAFINIAINLTLIFGYFLWSMQTRRRGSQFVLVAATFGVSAYPIILGFINQIWPVIIFAGIFGIFQAGQSLVLFDELMRRIPEEYSATFVAAAQALQYVSSIIAPLLAAWLAEWIGLSYTLILGGLISMLGFGLFLAEGGFRLRKPAQGLSANRD